MTNYKYTITNENSAKFGGIYADEKEALAEAKKISEHLRIDLEVVKWLTDTDGDLLEGIESAFCRYNNEQNRSEITKYEI